MEDTDHYLLVTKAIEYICAKNTRTSLEEIATHVDMSPCHLQRIFSRWAGLSPEQFNRYSLKERALNALGKPQSLLESSLELGLSSPSRLHDLTVKLESVTPAEYKSEGDGISIRHGIGNSPFGEVFLAWSSRGICRLGFATELHNPSMLRAEHLNHLAELWPKALICEDVQGAESRCQEIFNNAQHSKTGGFKLWVRGTEFQIKVWEALLSIQSGEVCSYKTLATKAGVPGAQRAVGTAIGNNDVAFLIPCHRVIKANLEIGQYRWGRERKHAILAWEAIRAKS